MNTGNAWGFALLGLTMSLLPILAPASFPATGIDGSSARALWVEVMGALQFLLGSAYLVRHGLLPTVVRWLNAEPAHVTVLDPVAAAEVLPFGDTLEQGDLFATERLEPEGGVALHPEHALLRRALQIALRDKERLVHFLQRLHLLAHHRGNRVPTDESGQVVLRPHALHRLVHLVQAGVVDLEGLARRGGDWLRDPVLRTFLGKITDEIDQVVGDKRRAA